MGMPSAAHQPGLAANVNPWGPFTGASCGMYRPFRPWPGASVTPNSAGAWVQKSVLPTLFELREPFPSAVAS